MKLKRAIWIGVLLYVATFAIGIIVGLIFGTDFTGEQAIGLGHWILSIVLSVIVTALFSLWYFKGKVASGWDQGLFLGITYLVIGIVFDGLFLIPYVFVGGSSGVVAYYSDPLFYVSVLLVVLTAVFVGGLKKK